MNSGNGGKVLAFLAAALVLNACGGDDPKRSLTSVATPKAKLEAKSFDGCGEYRDYFSASLSREILEGGYACWGCEFFVTDGAPGVQGAPPGPPVPGAAEGAAGGDASTAGFTDVSGTNTQETGVDEADLIKADARGYFYVARGSELLVIRATPANDLVVSTRLSLQGTGYAYARGLYLDDTNHRLVVLIDGAAPDYAAESYPARYGTGLLFLDVTDPAAPEAVDWLWTEGWLFDSRRVESRLHFVSSHYFWWPQALNEDVEFQQRQSAYYEARYNNREAEAEQLATLIRADVDAAVQAAPLSELLPLQKSGLDDSAPQPVACDSILHADVEHRLAMLLITSVDTDGGNPDTLGTINNAWQLYASSENLYLAQLSGGWWFDENQTQQTAIYRFTLTDGPVVPAGFGVVDGWTQGSYNFGEHEGALRVATTENRFRDGDSGWFTTNHLFVLGDGEDGNLKTLGAVRNFIEDESIFSSRFLGDRGYVVTFRQVDPLFVFDLSNPAAPQLAGQVEIPGFSTYIHPLDADHLLTIGRQGGEGGVGVGNNIELKIFDVSDPTAPAVLDSWSPTVSPDDWVWSVAEYDPHAFTYYAPEKLLSIPAQVGSPYGENSFSGFFALRVDTADGFTELGSIDHKLAAGGGSGCPPPVEADATGTDCTSFAPVYYSLPERSVVGVDGEQVLLFTLSSAMLKSGDVADLSVELDSLNLEPE